MQKTVKSCKEIFLKFRHRRQRKDAKVGRTSSEDLEPEKAVPFRPYTSNEHMSVNDALIVLDESKSDEDDVYKTLMKNINFLS
jgi:hypothetical protein